MNLVIHFVLIETISISQTKCSGSQETSTFKTFISKICKKIANILNGQSLNQEIKFSYVFLKIFGGYNKIVHFSFWDEINLKSPKCTKKETDTIHVSQCVTMLKNSRFARLIAAPNFLNSDFLAKKRVENYCTQQEKEKHIKIRSIIKET